MLHLRSQLKSIKDHFEFYFIEANPKIISHSNVYKEAAGVFNFALTNEDKINITKLFITNNNYLSQGNSILKQKKMYLLINISQLLGCPHQFFSRF